MARDPRTKPKAKRGPALFSIPAPSGDSESVRIRQISNGYLISRSGAKRGKYFEHEEFSPTKPTITAGKPETASAPSRKDKR